MRAWLRRVSAVVPAALLVLTPSVLLAQGNGTWDDTLDVVGVLLATARTLSPFPISYGMLYWICDDG